MIVGLFEKKRQIQQYVKCFGAMFLEELALIFVQRIIPWLLRPFLSRDVYPRKNLHVYCP